MKLSRPRCQRRGKRSYATDHRRAGKQFSCASVLIWTHCFVSAKFDRVRLGFVHAEMENAFFRNEIDLLPTWYRTRNADSQAKHANRLRRANPFDRCGKALIPVDNLNVFAGLWDFHKV
jgi:hypothetical protein